MAKIGICGAGKMGSEITRRLLECNQDVCCDLLKERSRQNSSQFILSIGADLEAKYLDGFTFIEHQDNIALALDVCEEIGIKKQVKRMVKGRLMEEELFNFTPSPSDLIEKGDVLVMIGKENDLDSFSNAE